MIADLERVLKYMQRITYKSKRPKYETNTFFAQADLLAGGILRQTDPFLKVIREFYDRSGQT